MTDTLTPDAVQAWLHSLKDEEVCGVAGLYRECPLARYLATTGAPDPHVGLLSYGLHGAEGHRALLPDWALTFVEKLDAWGGHDERPIPTSLARLFLTDAIRKEENNNA